MEIKLILRAATFAAKAHAKQMRKTGDQPYINHLLRVAQAAGDAGLSEEAIAAALLHDVIEDTEVTIEELSDEFPDRVVRLVHLLTQWWPDDAPSEVKESERPKYYGEILTDPELAEVYAASRNEYARRFYQSALRKLRLELRKLAA